MGSIAENYKRWRHSRGYGVHSPLAYKVIKEALYPDAGYGWYGYEDIDDLIREFSGLKWKRMRKDARMLLRLLSFFNCKTSDIGLKSMPEYRSIFKRVAEIVSTSDDSAKYGYNHIYIGVGDEDEAAADEKRILTHAIDGDIILLMRLKETNVKMLSNSLCKVMERGLLLQGRHFLLLIPDGRLVFTEYTCS